ncbi:MAG: tetratricopeptide repeat protein [Alphaproteobacteria bacterium]
MANMLSHNKNTKPTKKTMEDHAEDALYREITEEVYAEKVYSFVKKHTRSLIAGIIMVVILVVAFQLYRNYRISSANAQAKIFESAIAMSANGNIDDADAEFARAAAKSSGGMGDLALWESAMMDLRAGKGIIKLEKLAKEGSTRDFRDLALIRLSAIRGDSMSSEEFEKFLSPVLTEKSPFYYTGMLLIAQKYISVGDKDIADKWLNKLINDKHAPAIIMAMAESLK